MAYGKNRDQLLLKEPTIEIGTWATPQLVINGATDPIVTGGWTSGGVIGYIGRGTFNSMVTREYATFEAGTPAEVVRMDLIRKPQRWEFAIAQLNIDLWGLVFGWQTATGTYPIAFHGFDEPTQTFNGFLATTSRVDGTVYQEALWYAKCVSEDVSKTFSGDAHVTVTAAFNAFCHPNFYTTPADQRCYGAEWTRP